MSTETCCLCHARFRWNYPGQKGVMQTFYRRSAETRNGKRCFDRNSCKKRQERLAQADSN